MLYNTWKNSTKMHDKKWSCLMFKSGLIECRMQEHFSNAAFLLFINLILMFLLITNISEHKTITLFINRL